MLLEAESSCSVNHIEFTDQDANWIQMNGSLKPDLFYSDKLHLVEKGNLILAKSIYISVKSHYRYRKNYQLSKTHKSVTVFSLNNADFPTLTPLSPRKPVSDCISVSPYKSVHNSFLKPVQKPSYISSIKPVLIVVRKCSVYNSSLGARNECVKPVQKPSYISSIKPVLIVVRKCSVYNSSLGARNECVKPVQKPSYISFIKPVPIVVRKCPVYNSSLGAQDECVDASINHTVCQASVTHFSEYPVNVHRKVFKGVLSSLFVSTVSAPPANVVKVTTTPLYQYTNPASKHAIVQACF